MCRAGALTGVDARYIKTIGTPLAALATASGMRSTNDLEFGQVCTMLKTIFEQQAVDDDAGGETDAENALRVLLSRPVQTEQKYMKETGPTVIRELITVFDLVSKVPAVSKSTGVPDGFAQRSLKMYGLARADISGVAYLFVASNSDDLRRLLAGTAYASQVISSVLKNLVGVKAHKQRMAGVLVNGIIVPVSHLLTETLAQQE